RANCHLPYWANLKRFRLVSTDLSRAILEEKGWISATGQLDRAAIVSAFSTEIAELYQEGGKEPKRPEPQSPRPVPQSSQAPSDFLSLEQSCPTIAQSLNLRFTS
ncbi:MAG: hypothetical protein VKJ24_21065, partial [Synechococcales bacterium]|nr:hypothetical protein [Synechococcales bacterium]